MKKYIKSMKKSRLFSNLDDEEILSILSCIGATVKDFKKDEYILRIGEHLDTIMILLAGQLCIQQEDYWGNRNVLDILNTGDTFGEAYLSPHSGPLINDVIATKDSTVMRIESKRLLTVCSCTCSYHTQAVQNFIYTITEKNRMLVGKINVITKRTTRDKLITYLSQVAAKHNNSVFEIPFNRQQLADYLSVDRSAMSKELCRMRDEGFLTFDKNHFELLKISQE